MAAGQSADSLVYYRLENRGGQVFYGRAVIDQRLNIRLGKNTASGGDGIDHLLPFSCFIQSRRISIEQNRHLVDKRSRASGTGTIHSLLNGRTVKRDLCIFASQFYRHIGFRNQCFNGLAAGYDFLFKMYAQKFCQGKSPGTRNHRLNPDVPIFVIHVFNQFFYLVEHVGHVPFVPRKNYRIIIVQQNQFDRR